MRIISLFILCLLTAGITSPLSAQNNKTRPAADKTNNSSQSDRTGFSMLNFSATDALGRSFGPASGKQNNKKYVGVFYSLWLGQHKSGQKDIYDIQKLLNTNPAALKNVKGTPESPLNEFHFWGEPLYGYYSMSDPWIVTRQIELLTNAGVDYLCIDATNRVVYTESVKNLFSVLLRFEEQGFKVPKIVFYTNSHSGATVDDLYNQFYKSGDYDKLWFRPVDKPMIIGITEKNNKASDMTKYNQFTDFIKPAMQEYFDVRESQWPNGDYNPNSIPWMSWQYPQWNHNGTVAVPVAQHSHSVIAASAQHPESSRGYNNRTKKVEEDWTAGASFQTMWDAVFESRKEINHVLITSFNEWMAIKYADAHGHDGVFFVDVYNHEFSRDIEIMKGGYGDNFYLQLVRNIRKFKLSEGNPVRFPAKSIDIRKATEDTWKDVKTTYVDVAGDALGRNFANASGTGFYTDSSNRNDITEVKVTHDSRNVYFMIKTLEDITPYNGKDLSWMNILIAGDTKDSSFAGYTHIINRKPSANQTTSLERSTGGYAWKHIADINYTVKGNIMQVAIPLSALGLQKKGGSFQFKVADNVTKYDDIMDYYISGDSAPVGRLNFTYSTGEFASILIDFENDIYQALNEAFDRLVKYSTIIIIFPKKSYYPHEILKGFTHFCQDFTFQYKIISDVSEAEINSGDVYINLIEEDLVTLIEKIKTTNYVVGEEVGIISYNETPIKRVVLNGITTISSDFHEMGVMAAKAILSGTQAREKVPFRLTLRPSL